MSGILLLSKQTMGKSLFTNWVKVKLTLHYTCILLKSWDSYFALSWLNVNNLDPCTFQRHRTVKLVMMKSAKPVLTLNQFMIRGQVIKQYRDFLRTAKRLPDENMKKVTYLKKSAMKHLSRR